MVGVSCNFEPKVRIIIERINYYSLSMNFTCRKQGSIYSYGYQYLHCTWWLPVNYPYVTWCSWRWMPPAALSLEPSSEPSCISCPYLHATVNNDIQPLNTLCINISCQHSIVNKGSVKLTKNVKDKFQKRGKMMDDKKETGSGLWMIRLVVFIL